MNPLLWVQCMDKTQACYVNKNVTSSVCKVCIRIQLENLANADTCMVLIFIFNSCYTSLHFPNMVGAAASSLGSAVCCRVEGRAIDTALGQCFIPNSSH